MVVMRAAGDPAGSRPVLSADIAVAARHAYTVAGMGQFGTALRLAVRTHNSARQPVAGGMANITT
jgi:hypothetical protein